MGKRKLGEGNPDGLQFQPSIVGNIPYLSAAVPYRRGLPGRRFDENMPSIHFRFWCTGDAGFFEGSVIH